ncbi:hypothetical protein CSAL01_08025 [Colletotrichum salicis]|uniref:Uncharacterized protein n=1 Tax=Colletotrichum salicis TaxID=1209931 RepID=A0A135TG36_9PEZI|nr:hypothetical protein CSAL01_08025 [Colletotrichum salicis]
MSGSNGGLDFDYPARNKTLYQEQIEVGHVDGDGNAVFNDWYREDNSQLFTGEVLKLRAGHFLKNCILPASTYSTAGVTPDGKARLRCMSEWPWKECKRTLEEYKSWRVKYTVKGTISFHGRGIQPIGREDTEDTAQDAQRSPPRDQSQTQVAEEREEEGEANEDQKAGA